jgi:hypothetical protein
VTTPTRGPREQVFVRGVDPTPTPCTQPPAVAQVARVQRALAAQRQARNSGVPSMPRNSNGVPTDRSTSVGCLMGGKATNPGQVRGPLVHQPANAARLAAILHNAAMDLWDVATEEDPAQMWEEARAIASRILAACPTR